MSQPENPTTPPPAEQTPAPPPAPGFDIELPACFYLGREYDLAARKVLADRPPVMYDARDLLTHGVVVGMTGSGKTGLCINILEEAAIDGIPCIILDIKGDLCNLLLQFPDLDPEDFKRWLNPEDARTQGLTLDAYAQKLSERWKQGLEETLQGPERVRRLRESAEWLVYTPGSDAGLPLSILKTFAAPKPLPPREELTQKIDATASALLGLTGIVGDPVQSREHVLIATLLEYAWENGQDLTLQDLIDCVRNPPMEEIGALPVDEFYSKRDRLKLAVSLNNILASPSFSTWINGDALDLSKMLYAGDKPRHVIFYLAHLDDAQRMFFLTLLLDEVLTWTRKQPGTTNLRSILYFDEVYGYLPPHPANPPTKQPLMTLLKQARAFGVGVLLATQNPVDLDYKALSNAGTWMVGKLQTERDKARLLEGLEGVAAERGTLADRSYLENVISALGNRVFLLHDVHRPKPILFQTRWALSFLRGPMTRDQIKQLVDPVKERRKAESPVSPAPVRTSSAARQQDQAFKEAMLRGHGVNVGPLSRTPPELPKGFQAFYLPVREPVSNPLSPPAPPINLTPRTAAPPGALPVAQLLPDDVPDGTHLAQVASRQLVYLPRVLGFAEVPFALKRGTKLWRAYRLLAEVPPVNQSINWMAAEHVPETLGSAPAPDARWATIPEGWAKTQKLQSIKTALSDFLVQNAKLALYQNEGLGMVSEPGEDLGNFLKRCQEAARQAAEKEIAAEKAKYQPKFDKLTAQIPPELTPPPPPEPASSFVWRLPVLGWFKPAPPPPPPPKPIEPKVLKAKEELARLQEEWVRRRDEIAARWRAQESACEELRLDPQKTGIKVGTFGIAWAPFWFTTFADGRSELTAAYEREKGSR